MRVSLNIGSILFLFLVEGREPSSPLFSDFFSMNKIYVLHNFLQKLRIFNNVVAQQNALIGFTNLEPYKMIHEAMCELY